jgi:hypothetical protein
MSCRHSLALGTCVECYPETGTVPPEGPGDSLDGPDAVSDLGYIAELNHSGDVKFTWDRKNPKDCEAAHEYFDAMKKKGLMIFKVKIFGRKGAAVKRFNPKDGSYLFTAPAEAAELAHKFEPEASYVAAPPVAGG